jgi:hypothetical protein
MTASKVQIPDFFLALVALGASREATEQDCEELRQQTIHSFTKCLTNTLTLKTLNAFSCTLPNPCLTPRMQIWSRDSTWMYFEVSAEAEFSRASTCAAPSDEDVFGVMLCSESIDYLVEHVREVNPKSIFVATVELSAQRLNIDKKRPRGTVKAPTFYIAFVSRDAHRQPTQEEIEECKKHAHKLIEENGCGTSGAGCHVFGTNYCHQSAQRGTNDRVGRTTSRGKMNVCGEQNAECRPEFSRCVYRNLVSSCMHVLFQLETAAIPRVGLQSVSAEYVVDCSPSFFCKRKNSLQ